MTLNASGPISLGGATTGQSVNLELGQSATTTISFNDAAVRTLTGTTAGTSLSMPSGFWGKSSGVSLVISSNQVDLNLRTWALANGWNGNDKVTITLNNSVYIYSTGINSGALVIDGSWPNGLKFINNGYVLGKGGDGGSNAAGSNGMPAVYINAVCTIVNNGYLAGGGGGGGGAFNSSMHPTNYAGGGGGAGGGAGGNLNKSGTFYSGGAGGAVNSVGSSGTASPTPYYSSAGAGGGRIAPGTGGAGGTWSTGSTGTAAQGGGSGGGGGTLISQVSPQQYESLAGGGGGGWGAAGGSGYAWRATGPGTTGGAGGSAGATGGNGSVVTGGTVSYAGGAGGKAIALNGYSITFTDSGTTYGAVS